MQQDNSTWICRLHCTPLNPNKMKRLLNSIVLLIVAIVLAAALFPIGFIYAIAYALIKLRDDAFLGYFSDFFYSIALGIDKIGNAVLGGLFNAIMVKKSDKIYPFGNINDTISYVLSQNIPYGMLRFKFGHKQSEKLTWLGWWLVCLLEFIDPDHMYKTRKRRY